MSIPTHSLVAEQIQSEAPLKRDEMVAPTEVSSSKMFEGYNKRYKHKSEVLGCFMNFSIYFPPAASTTPVPVSIRLSLFISLAIISNTADCFSVSSIARRWVTGRTIAEYIDIGV